MSRFISWLAQGIAAAFLTVASASFTLSAITWLAFAISIGTLVVATATVYYDRHRVTSIVTGLLVAVVSAWTIVATLVFSQPTVQRLALASSLAISGLALVGLTANEVSQQRSSHSVEEPVNQTPVNQTSNHSSARFGAVA